MGLESLAGSRPSKMRKGNTGEARPVVETAAPQEELVDQAHQGLFHLLSSIGQEPVHSKAGVSCLPVGGGSGWREGASQGCPSASATCSPLPGGQGAAREVLFANGQQDV